MKISLYSLFEKIIFSSTVLCFFCLFFSSCYNTSKPDLQSHISATDTFPQMFPDYNGVTIPSNIAPLNFRIDEDMDAFYIRVTGSDSGEWEYSVKKKIQFNRSEWKQMIEINSGGKLSIEVYGLKDDNWYKWKSIELLINETSIDSHMVYRLIEPGYEKWHIVGIYQRNLENFNEEVIIRNDMTDYNCINCHSFCQGDPDQMLLHMRAENSGTLIMKDQKIQKLTTKTEQTLSHFTYPYWHPSGRYIASSVNDTKQFFHATADFKMEVFDTASDILIYDVEKKCIISDASILNTDSYETYPMFSPDGKWLYFCSAEPCLMPDSYKNIRYHLCRVAFDSEKAVIGTSVDTLFYATDKSCAFPRISPDGRFLMYTETAYGQFPIWHKDAELRLIDLEKREEVDISRINSPDTESYHSWSKNSRWVAFSSRRKDGLYTLPYICFVDEAGRSGKPFLLPQEDPDTYDYQLYSYNIPELITSRVTLNPYKLQHVAKTETAIPVFYK